MAEVLTSHQRERGTSAVSFDSVEFGYRDGPSVGPLSFELRTGSITGLVGSNGAGKTTIMRLMCGLLQASAGTVTVDGVPVAKGYLPQGVGAVIEEPPLVQWTSGRMNLQLAAAGRSEWLDRVGPCLTTVGLAKAADVKVAQYSQGMRQRLGIARALLGAPRLLILDEPTNGLDPVGMQILRELLGQLRDQGAAIVVSSHLLGEIRRTADTVLFVRAGQIVRRLDQQELASSLLDLEELYFAAAGDDA